MARVARDAEANSFSATGCAVVADGVVCATAFSPVQSICV